MLIFNDAMSSASFNSILALFCSIFKYKFGMVNKVVIKLSCVIGIKDINQSNRHYNPIGGASTKKLTKSQLTIMCKLWGSNMREFRKEILQAMQVGGRTTNLRYKAYY